MSFSEKRDSRIEVYLESLPKFGLFPKSYIYSERGSFSASFHVKNSISIFLQKIDFSKEGRPLNTSGKTRHSIPLFFGPDYFTQIKCLINDQIPKYPTVIADEYLTKRFDETYNYRQKESSCLN